MRMKGLILTAIIGTLTSADALAGPSEVLNRHTITQTIMSLVLVIGIIALFAWVLRKFSNRGWSQSDVVRCLAALPVGTRERIALISAGDKQILVGITPHNIQCLHVFDEPIVDVTNKPEASFVQALKNAISARTSS